MNYRDAKQTIFVGRRDQRRVFRETISDLLMDKPKKLLSTALHADDEFSKPNRRIFHFYGEGGLGKTALTQQLHKIALDESRQQNVDLRVIALDWDWFYDKYNVLPNDGLKIMNAIYTMLVEAGYKKYFKEYETMLSRKKELDDRVDREHQRQSQTLIADVITDTASLATGGMPVPAIGRRAIEKGVEKISEFIGFLRSTRAFSEEEIQFLGGGSEKLLSTAFVKGLAKASFKVPIILSIDTYERVDDNPKVDEWMRTVFLRLLLEQENRIITLISGRNNHGKAYRDTFPEELLYIVSFDDILFSEKDIQEYATRVSVPLEPDMISRIGEVTRGVPLAVKDIIESASRGDQLETIMDDYQSHRSQQIREVVAGVAKRFIKYCKDDPTDRSQVYHLAISRRCDIGLLSSLWEMREQDVIRHLIELTLRHSFVNEGTMHDLVKTYVRKHLMDEIAHGESAIERHLIDSFGGQAGEYYHGKLREVEKQIPVVRERYDDKEYQAYLLDYFNSIMWKNTRTAMNEFPGYFLESFHFNSDFCEQLLRVMNAFEPILSSKQRNMLGIVRRGFGNNYVWSKEWRKLIETMHDLAGDGTFTPLQAAILHFYSGELYYSEKEYQKAVDEYERALESDREFMPTERMHTDIHSKLGIAYYHIQRYREAAEMFKKYLGAEPKSFEAMFNLGLALTRIEEYPEAETHFRKASELLPEDASAYYCIGLLAEYRNELNRAADYYKKAIETDKQYLLAQHNMAKLQERLDNKEAALNHYKSITECEAESASDYFKRGYANYEIERYTDAIDDYSQAIEHGYESSDVFTNRGHAYYSTRQYEKAYRDFDEAIRRGDHSPSNYANRGNALHYLGKYALAIEDYDRSIELETQNPYDYCFRGLSYSKLGDFDTAIKDCTRAIEMDPEEAGLYHNRAVAYYRKLDFDSAIMDFDKALQLKSNDMDTHFNRIEVLIAAGRYEAAISAIRECSALMDTPLDSIILKYMTGLSHVLSGSTYSDSLQDLMDLLRKERVTKIADWDFDDIRAYLTGAEIDPVKKEIVSHITSVLEGKAEVNELARYTRPHDE